MQLRLPPVFLCIVSCAFSAERPNVPAIRLNPAALEFAQQLIREGRVVLDGKGAWAGHRPSPREENEFIRLHGLGQYAKWHLGIDRRHGEETKTHHKFPFGDFTALHRCGLLAVKARAHEYGYAEIEIAADELLSRIEIKRPTRRETHRLIPVNRRCSRLRELPRPVHQSPPATFREWQSPPFLGPFP